MGTGKLVTANASVLQASNGAIPVYGYAMTSSVPSGNIGTIVAKQITMTGLGATDKIYNGTTSATVTGAASLTSSEAPGAGSSIDGKWYVGDTVNITGPPVGTFNSKNVAEANSVTFSQLSLTGAQSGNYTLVIQSPVTAYITPKTVTLSASKTYDGTTAFAGTQVNIGTGVGAEVLTYSGAASNDAHVGSTLVRLHSVMVVLALQPVLPAITPCLS